MVTKTKAVAAPWVGLGEPVDANMTAAAMRKAARQDYTVSKRPICFTDSKGKLIAIKDKYAIVRDSDDKMLSIVGSVYKPVQTELVFSFFHDFVKEAKMKMESAGALGDGKFVWAMARVTGADFSIGKRDGIRNYLLLCSPFEHGKALQMFYTNVREICENMFTMPIDASLRGGKGHAFRMPHTKNFEVEKEEAKRVLGLITAQSKEFKGVAELLSKTKCTKEQAQKYFMTVLGKGPDPKRTPAAFPKYTAALEFAPGADLPSAKGTWWGALNAVSYVVDHEQGRSRDTALKNAWLGNQSKLKRRALRLALEGAGA